MIQLESHLGAGRDHLGELLRDLVLVEAGFGNVEVEPSIHVADRAASHRIGQHRREQVQRGVHAHAGIAQVPVDDGVHRLADLEAEPRGGRRQMRDLGLAGDR